ncbi:IspD/TarI family cytidylyltransferase [Mycobacterium sp. SMC-4]|uniref:IspD/TarI family cytidylyltransferase n=1 Tax=Mycobacterium sp. SMC-4 TaxID=2857059 RepID=UPI003D07FC6A
MTAIVPVPVCDIERFDAVLRPVAGRSALDRIVDTLRTSAPVVVAVAAEFVDAVRGALSASIGADIGVVAATGDGRRVACLSAGLGACAAGPVLVHHLSWPVFSPATTERVISALTAGALVVAPMRAVTDSVKRVDGRGVVTGTVDRSRLRAAQYPRGFDAATLEMLLETGREPFDELLAALRAGVPVTEIDGDDHAARVDLPRDAAFLSAVIEA